MKQKHSIKAPRQKHSSPLQQLRRSFTALIKPKHSCLLCDTKNQERICTGCQSYLLTPRHRCQACGIPLKHASLMCGECLKQPPLFDETYSPYLYQTPLDQLINDFKHKNNQVAGKAISTLFCKAICTHYKEHHLAYPQWLLPIPLHWRRQWQRGFNQAAFLSDDLSQQLGIKVFKYAKKKQYTSSQEGLSRKQRLLNLRNSFSITRDLNGESVAIVDDVMTTGTTANSLAHALKKAGAGKISVWVVARTPRSRER